MKAVIFDNYITNHYRQFIVLCKPKVVLLLLVTAMVGMRLATTGDIKVDIMIIATIGIGLAASSAAVINHVVDINIDAQMKRTERRPLVAGTVKRSHALIFSLVLASIAMWLLVSYVNVLTAMLSLAGLIGYAFIYTIFLKHNTPQNIVFGGLSGALPPLLGWTSMTNSIDFEAILLMLIIFIWTPAHFWPLAIDRIDDYRKAKVPMLPVTHGIEHTKNYIVIYTVVLVFVSVLPYFFAMNSVSYLICALLLGAWFLFFSLKLKYACTEKTAMTTFYVSIIYLFLLFIALVIDHAVATAF